MINFFYGRNGTGKSTLARAIYDKRGLKWKDRDDVATSEATKIMIFDEKYIKETIKSYDGIQGVFTLAEDVKYREELDSKIAERKKIKADLDDARRKSKSLSKDEQKITQRYYDEIWERNRTIRDDLFPKLSYSTSKKNLFRDLLQYQPFQTDVEELKSKYKIIYEDVQAQYEFYQTVDHIILPSSDIIYKPIISGSDKEFAKFARALGNLRWVREGYDKYLHNSDVKCPFCQREGLDISSLEDLFDEQYDTDIKELKAFVSKYKDACEQIKKIHGENIKNRYSLKSELIRLYQQEFNTFRKAADINLSLLNDKLQDFSLELNNFVDLSLHLKKNSECIQRINAEISAYMKLVMDNQHEQKRFYSNVCSLMSFKSQDIFARHKEEHDDIEERIKSNSQDIADKEK